MDLYVFNRERLSSKKIKVSHVILSMIALLVFSCTVSYYAGKYTFWSEKSLDNVSLVEREIIIKKTCTDDFSEEKLIEMLKSINVKFPEIVLAQAILETGEYKSNIFLENNNLFGMKEAKLRPTTSSGTNLHHAYYNTWRESVYDYVLYQCRYLCEIETEDEYYQYLNANYAEIGILYSSALKTVIKRHKVYEKFKDED